VDLQADDDFPIAGGAGDQVLGIGVSRFHARSLGQQRRLVIG
jgi:hypothetical protein